MRDETLKAITEAGNDLDSLGIDLYKYTEFPWEYEWMADHVTEAFMMLLKEIDELKAEIEKLKGEQK